MSCRPFGTDLKELVDTFSERQNLVLWHAVAGMKPSETWTPDEVARVGQALKEIEAGDFVDWQDLKRTWLQMHLK